MNDAVTVHLADSIAVLSMNRPGRKNAMDTAMLEALVSSLRDLENSDASGLVVTGAGGVFSAGADVSEKVDASGAHRRMLLFTQLYELVTGFPKPTVAAIAGHCIGGGAEVAAGCDLRVGSRSASIRFPGARFTIPIGTARLPLLVGLSHAKDLLMTARAVNGDEAFRMGFLNRLVDEGELLTEAIDLAQAMAGNPGAISQKRLLAQSVGLNERVAEENRGLVRWQKQAQSLMGD